MRTKTLLAGLTVAFLAVPFISSAATIGELQAQIASLLAQIQALQMQGSASTSVSGSGVSGSGSITGTVTASCPSFSRSLSIGDRGEDVMELQAFLQAHGYLSASSTGYFGSLTRAALGHWQDDNGIAHSSGIGFGIFGPMSRSYYGRFCGSGNGEGQGEQNQQYFSADPQSGAAPLTVTFTTNDSINASTTQYSVDFGDGSSTSMTKGSCVGITAIVGGQGGIRCSYSVAHTYNSNGTYTAKLLKQTPFKCPAGLMCAQTASAFMLPAPQVVAATQITVGTTTPNSVSFTASPSSGVSSLTVQFMASAPQGTTLGNTVDFGDGTSAKLFPVPVCSSCNAMSRVSHTYTSAGTFTATLTNNLCSCPENGICNCPNIPILATTQVTVSATSTATSSDQRITAPATVTLKQGGVAEVRNQSYYFTLTSLSSTSATIQLTPVGCWNSFPSDTPPQIRCMIAVVPIPPITLSVGQTANNYPITLTQDDGTNAAFQVNVRSSY
ncbi:MAG: PKD domain-containing protein [Candidatus Pacebacteria bacterium]|nr:PKD domain-containing protein [Candidatus Paceibacterota bacterium]